jgi:large subunit ribosomal protein L23
METYRTLIKPMVTEKSNLGPQNRKYTFVVSTSATKADIKHAVEDRFKVTVTDVNTSNFAGKSKSRGWRSKGRKPNWKKAVVTVAKDQTIVELYEDLG